MINKTLHVKYIKAKLKKQVNKQIFMLQIKISKLTKNINLWTAEFAVKPSGYNR